MNDPLSESEFDQAFADFKTLLKQTYEYALRSGALNDDSDLYEKHSIALFKMVLQLAAPKCYPLSPEARKELKNLEHFV
jgi:hypothetical protein